MDKSKHTLSQISRVCDEFESSWLAGQRPELAQYLSSPSSPLQESLVLALLSIDIEHRRQAGDTPTPADYEPYGDLVMLAAEQILERPPTAMPRRSTNGSQALFDDFYAATSGRYQLLNPIGEGGMGMVWKTQQQAPVKRLVAVKLLRTDRLSQEARTRFSVERQILATMKHPNIPAIYDAGETSRGHAYLVMELIDGAPITTYCEQQQVGFEERIRLMVSVCRTIQYAHEQGIIHRDIKPTNVLIEACQDAAAPKLIDFGFAKSIGNTDEISQETLSTECGKLIGTLPYMSPEQASLTPSNADRRADVYSLGALAYQLLTGTTPLSKSELEKQVVWQSLEHVRRVEAERPSQRAKRNLLWAPDQLRRLANELDWILLKALEKSPERRYESAEQLAEDLERFLERLPVRAKPQTLIYQTQKFLVRRKALLAALGSASLMLMLGMLIGRTGGSASFGETPKLKNSTKEEAESKGFPKDLPEGRSQDDDNAFMSWLLQKPSVVMDLHVVPHDNSFQCYFTDTLAHGEYVLAYRAKWEGMAGLEWERWRELPLELSCRQQRGDLFDFSVQLPAAGSLKENTTYELKIKRKHEFVFGKPFRARTFSAPVLKSPLRYDLQQSLVFGFREHGEICSPGLYRIDRNGKVTNYLWDKEALPRTAGIELVPGSMVATWQQRDLWAVSNEGLPVAVREEVGALQAWKHLDFRQLISIAPNSLVCGPTWGEEPKVIGVFCVNVQGQIFNFHWLHEEQGFRVQPVSDHPQRDQAVAGSLVVSLNGQFVYGINPDNQLIYVTRSAGKFHYQVANLPVELVPGSLVCTTHGAVGEDGGAALYGVDIQQRLVHLVWKAGKLETRFVPGGESIIAGSLITSADHSVLYGVRGNAEEARGDVFQLSAENELPDVIVWQRPIFGGSLVWGAPDTAQDGQAPGLYGVDVFGTITNFRYLNDRWDIRQTVSAIPGTLVRHQDGNAIYAISRQGETLEIQQQAGALMVRDLDARY